MLRPRRFDWDNLWLRIVSGAILAPAALAIVWFDPLSGGVLALIAAAMAVISYEWAVMVAPDEPARVAVSMTASVLAVAFLTWPWDAHLVGDG